MLFVWSIMSTICLAAVHTSFDGQGALFLAGTTRSLLCFVDPPGMLATFTWFLGDSGSLVNTTTRVSIMNTSNTTTLQFSPLRTSDGSRYQCRLMMIDGTSVDVRDEIDLNVTGKEIVQPAHTHCTHTCNHTDTHAHTCTLHYLSCSFNIQSPSAVS